MKRNEKQSSVAAETLVKPEEQASEVEDDVTGVVKAQDAVDANRASPPDSALNRKTNEKSSVSWAKTYDGETSQKK